MLHSELLADRGVLVLSPEGALDAADFDRIAALVDPVIERDGKLVGVLVHAREFPGWADFAALVRHLRFVRDHHRKVSRVAVATDGALLGLMPAIAGHFVAAEVKRFAFDEKAQALAWLEGSAAPRP